MSYGTSSTNYKHCSGGNGGTMGKAGGGCSVTMYIGYTTSGGLSNSIPHATFEQSGGRSASNSGGGGGASCLG